AHQLADGAAQASAGAAQLPAGATALASGATQLGEGATELSGGLTQLADGTRQSAGGAGQLAAGLGQLSGQLTSTAPDTLGGAAATNVSYTNAAATATQGLAGTYQTLLAANNCIPPATPTTPEQGAVCLALGQLATGITDSATNAGYSAGYAAGVQKGLGTAAAGIDQLTAGASGLQSGLGTIADGLDQSATGATGLASGAAQLSAGGTRLADGATSLADGVSALSTGTASLADGLTQASASIPSYTDQQAKDLASVVADPVRADGASTTLFGASAIPLLAMLALWFGGLASFIALQAVPRHALSSRRSSVLLALRAFAPAAAIGAVQGLLVALVVQLAAGYDAGAWWTFAGLAVVAGIAFAAVNQALVAVFGGAGRWVSALIGVLAVATGIVSTVPGVLTAVAGLMPTTPAYTAMLAALTSAGGLGAGLAGMIVWAALALVVTIIAVARRRTAKASTLLQPAPALA
ncbi:hypothetical protein, partial [Microbacterium lacticum]|uniref:hypothetical protein n=1 Tax=Microbacterium lacticum TaxID=33885 RepID=UPI0028D439B8